MNDKKVVNTLTFKFWLYFVSFAISIFIILWFMQVIFFQSYYRSMKKNEIVNIVNNISEKYSQEGSTYFENLDSIAYKNSSSILIFDSEKNVVYNTSSYKSDKLQVTPTRQNLVDLSDVVDKALENNSKKFSYTLKFDRFKTEVYIYCVQLEDTDLYMAMVTPIDPIDATTNVLQDQLELVTILSVVISSIKSIFISRKLTNPIVKINESAKELAKGNYDIEFKKSGYTEIDDLADTLNYATSELAKTDKIRRELIANVSHDLKTPLTMIKAYAEMIHDLSGDNKEKREEHLNVIIEETDRLTRLVNDMMDLSKIESGEIKLQKEKFDLVSVLKNIVKTLDIANPNLIEIKSPENLYVFADKVKIEQVCYNLINNAINHSNMDENGKILVKVVVSSKKAKVHVIDNGIGIPKEDLSHIFERYYKVDKTYKRSSSGTGLGLSIVKNILDKHNFDYGVSSQVGKGSDFWFEIDKASNKK